MAREVFKSPLSQSQKLILNQPSTREKWNDWFKNSWNPQDPEDIHYYNGLLTEIENELPFANDEEHDKWYQMGQEYRGDSEWGEFTNEILSRGEPNYKGSDRAKEIADQYFSKRIGGYKPTIRK